MRRDRDIRVQLTADLEREACPDTVLIHELGIRRGQVRVDVAAVNGVIHGYEIKSAVDTTRRLANQAALYGQVLDLCTVVTAADHLERVHAMVPGWWGILVEVADRPGLHVERLAAPNPGRDVRAMAELLWASDVMDLLDRRGALKGVRGRPRPVLWDRLCAVYSASEIASEVRAALKRRATEAATAP